MKRRDLLRVFSVTPLVWLFPCLAEAGREPILTTDRTIEDPLTGFTIYPLGIWTNDEDIVIAHSAEDAVTVFKMSTGPWAQGYDQPCPWRAPQRTTDFVQRTGCFVNGSKRLHPSEHLFVQDQDGAMIGCRDCDAYMHDFSMVPGLMRENWSQWPGDKLFTLTEEVTKDELDRYVAENLENDPLGPVNRSFDFKNGSFMMTTEAFPRWWAQTHGRRYFASFGG